MTALVLESYPMCVFSLNASLCIGHVAKNAPATGKSYILESKYLGSLEVVKCMHVKWLQVRMYTASYNATLEATLSCCC